MKKLHEQFKTKIIYLAHPYGANPEQSWINACTWTSMLRNKGLIIFSPILHTHPYHEYLCRTRQQTSQATDQQMDYIHWDLALMEGMLKGDGYKREKYPFYIEFDSGIIVLLSKTAYYTTSLSLDDPHFKTHPNQCWKSDGCRQEYEWAKTHHVRVLELEAFLENLEVDL